jgi:heme/copper-type cytochrome/quinol oxidase subunit 2
VTKKALLIGLILFNLIYLGYFVTLALDDQENDEIVAKQVGLELTCWLISAGMQTVLIVSIFYTVKVLREIYPSESEGSLVRDEVNNMHVLAAIYIFALVFKSLFEIALFYAVFEDTELL